MTIDQAELEGYRVGLRRREAAYLDARRERRSRAMVAARAGAELLRTSFGASRVVVFGSAADTDGYFDAGSDIDLAAWGIADDDYFLAVAKLQDVSAEFSFDLIAMERCPEHLRSGIGAHSVAM